jgi:hypothetical protein
MEELIELARLVKAEEEQGFDFDEKPNPQQSVDLVTRVLHNIQQKEEQYREEGRHDIWRGIVTGLKAVRRANLLDLEMESVGKTDDN